MSRFLFVVPPLVGHINPTLGVAAELVRRGHEVAWAGLPDVVRPLAGERAAVFPCAAPPLDDPALLRPLSLRGPAALKFLWERFLVPLAEQMAPGVRTAVTEFRPDVLIADQQAVAGGLVAEQLGVPWATSATTSAGFTALAGMPKVEEWITDVLHALRQRIGDPASAVDPRLSDRLVLTFSTEELVGPADSFGDQVRFVGPSLASRPSTDDFPWDRLDPGRATVLITLGTANAEVGARFLATCAEAVRSRSDRLQAVVVDPSGALEESGEGLLVRPSVPQLALLERCDAVVCHGGHNTVCEALWHGLPLVVAPIRDDQPTIAAQVVDAGAGVRVRFGRATADQLGTALDAVLDEPGHRAAAERVGRSFRAAGGAAAAAAHLEHLAAPPATESR
ncbi:MGT family glycosyltransferase [Streptomyces sp. 2333.5]|uniref:glycosyltransferase n=1 Tax=unclassified Streptomyces TaxID=2593676 RepID=UPI000896CEA8|nr:MULTISPECIES: glycosyltransferase [unclassified Streptomyces]PJJ00715.1 MGT family glycosyltransferase [Streptomyces sp. 2333.5]SEC98703.1 glycosyltransferase, MGT family [Streptomyces sp. 2112.2]